MKASRFLPLLNLIGCLAITGIIIAQWTKERGLEAKLTESEKRIGEIQTQYTAEQTRAAALENDVRQLKESVEAAAIARKESEEAMAKLIAERDAHLASTTTEATAREEQVKAWEKGIADRDAKIRELNAALTATRQRLDEAVDKLKQAGAR